MCANQEKRSSYTPHIRGAGLEHSGDGYIPSCHHHRLCFIWIYGSKIFRKSYAGTTSYFEKGV